MPKVKITNTFAKKVKSPTDKRKEVYSDTIDTGLVLEVRATGTKTFYYRYNTDGKTHQKKLSSSTAITADEARKLVQQLKSNSERTTPITINESKLQDTNTITLNQFFTKYYLPHIQLHSKSWKKNLSTFQNHILPELGDIQLDQLSTTHIAKVHLEAVTIKGLAHGTANKIPVFLRHCFNIALDIQLSSITHNPARKVKLLKEKYKERYLSKSETKKLIEAISTSKNIHLKYIVPYLLLTGARKTEVLEARWKDIDIENLIWTIPKTKNGKIRYIPISKQLHQLILQIPRTKSPYLFTSPLNPNEPYRDIYTAWDNAKKRAGVEDIVLHSLRHTFASQLVNNGVSLYEVQKLLGHASSTMTQRYAHLSNDSLIKAVSKAGKLLK